MREEAEANGAIVIAPSFVRNTGIVSVPDFVSATGNAFVPFTPMPSEHDPLAEELEEKVTERVQSSSDQRKCRTCNRQFVIDEKAKDLCEEENAVMLYHIEVITGIWVCISIGYPHYSKCLSVYLKGFLWAYHVRL